MQQYSIFYQEKDYLSNYIWFGPSKAEQHVGLRLTKHHIFDFYFQVRVQL
jgi:hypothetical protein